MREDDTIGGLLSCTKAREANYVSGVHQQLGAADQAVTTADEALALSLAQPVRSYATEAQIRLNRVSAFVQLGDLETASEALRPVLLLPPDRRLDTLTRRVARVGETLASPRFARSRTARSLREGVASFAVDAR